MPTANAVAKELRKLADQLDRKPDIEIVKPTVHFSHGHSRGKDQFLSLASVFPRPLKKGDGWQHEEYTLSHDTDALDVYACIDRSKVCTVVIPAREAVYDCVPLLSIEEEAEIEA